MAEEAQDPVINIKSQLEQHGYAIVPDVLTRREIDEATDEFHRWRTSVANLDKLHNLIETNGIYKFHEVGHQRFAWLLRTNAKILQVFQELWECDELVCSFDGSCYYPVDYECTQSYWTHCDQSCLKKGLQCYQSFVSLTDNVERTFVVYDGSHKLNDRYNESHPKDEPREFNIIDESYTETIKDSRRLLRVEAGSLVIWDSRVFHQNDCGPHECMEERLVQYLCYLPKHDERNTTQEQIKRAEYFRTYRTTPHLPYPISAVPLQSAYYTHYKYDEVYIDYSRLRDPLLDDLLPKIHPLL